MGFEELNTPVRTVAVLIIANENYGEKEPLIVIREILPSTPENLRGGNTSGPSFRTSFAPNADHHAMATSIVLFNIAD